MSLGGIVEESRGQQVRIVVAGTPQPGGDVQCMAPVGDRHALEDGGGPIGQCAAHEERLLRFHPRPNVGDELPDPMHRSGPA